ncbi:MAG: PAAR domain-containing protein [Flavobacteriaceae bacterium]
MPAAARLNDFHECPMESPDPIPIPHVGGPIVGPGQTNVIIGGQPAAKVGDMLVCKGPPDFISEGSSTVMIGGMPAARVGDATAHGGRIVIGDFNVIIGG